MCRKFALFCLIRIKKAFIFNLLCVLISILTYVLQAYKEGTFDGPGGGGVGGGAYFLRPRYPIAVVRDMIISKYWKRQGLENWLYETGEVVGFGLDLIAKVNTFKTSLHRVWKIRKSVNR